MNRIGLLVNWFVLITFIVSTTGVLISEGMGGQVRSSMYVIAGGLVILSHMELIVNHKNNIEEEEK